MDTRPIGVFDSGLGGLTVVKELKKELPNENIIYFGDTGRVPYGSRGTDTIIRYVKQDISFLKTFDIKAIVVACGTASAVALPVIKDNYDLSILGVVEPTAAYAKAVTKNKKIGILGTNATISSGVYQRLLTGYEIYTKACPLFVPLVENGYAEAEAARLIAADYLSEMKENNVDTIILGCTHYPLLYKAISDIMGEGVTLINSGVPTAKELKRILAETDSLNLSGGKYQYYVSDMTEEFTALAETFLETKGTEIKKVDIYKYE